MTRKVTFSIILILLIVSTYLIMFSSQENIREKIASVQQLEASSKEINTKLVQLESKCTTDYEEKKNELSIANSEYKKTKEEYDGLMALVQTDNPEATIEEYSEKDIYNVDFLWTIIGNYATEEGIKLKFEISRNTSSISSLANTSDNYIVCDLNFSISGNYINLTDFIYDLEDDDRLNFEINDFKMTKSGSDLQVTLTVKEVKINSDSFIESSSSVSTSTTNALSTQEISDTTTNNTDESTEVDEDVN